MEKQNERIDSLKIGNYIIQNTIKLIKKDKVSNVKMVIKNEVINIDIDNCIYTIPNMLVYKKFIDNISYKHKILLRYIPSIENNNFMNTIKYMYYKNKQVVIVLNKEDFDIF